VGDVNGDSYDDFAVGAPGNADAGLRAGHVYLILGSPEGPRFAPASVPGASLAQSPDLREALNDLSESSWEAFRQIVPFQAADLSATAEGLHLGVAAPFGMGFFAFYQTRDAFVAPPAGLHVLRFALHHERAQGYLLPDFRVRVFTEDNSASFSTRATEATGGTLPTVIDVPFVSDGVWPIRVSVDVLSFDRRMFGGWTVTGIEMDP